MTTTRNPSCDGKVRHRSAQDAQKAIRSILTGRRQREHRKRPPRVYRCSGCGGYHIGGGRRQER